MDAVTARPHTAGMRVYHQSSLRVPRIALPVRLVPARLPAAATAARGAVRAAAFGKGGGDKQVGAGPGLVVAVGSPVQY